MTDIKKIAKGIAGVLNSSWVFQIALLIVMLSAITPPTLIIYKKLIYIFVPWGLYLMARSFWKKELKLDKEKYLPMAFIVFGFISVLVNFRESLAPNTFVMLFAMIYFYIYFISKEVKSIDEIKNKVNIIGWMVIIPSFILSLVSIILFLMKMKGEYAFFGETYLYGGYERAEGFFQLVGVYNGASTLADMADLSIIMSLILLLTLKGKKMVLLIINIVIQFLVLALSNNLTGIIALFISLSFAGFFISFKTLTESQNRTYKALMSSGIPILVSIAIFVSLLGVTLGIQKIGDFYMGYRVEANDNYMAEESQKDYVSLSEESQDQSKELDENQDDSRISPRYEKNDEEISNDENSRSIEASFATGSGRYEIYKAVIKKWMKNPIIGYGYKGIILNVKRLGELQIYNNPHNGYFAVLISNGILGFALIILFFALFIIKSVREIILRKLDLFKIGSITFVGFVLIYNLAMSQLILERSVLVLTLFIFLGYVSRIDNIDTTVK